MWSSLLDIGYNWVTDSWKKSQVPFSDLIMGSYLGKFISQPTQEVSYIDLMNQIALFIAKSYSFCICRS